MERDKKESRQKGKGNIWYEKRKRTGAEEKKKQLKWILPESTKMAPNSLYPNLKTILFFFQMDE